MATVNGVVVAMAPPKGYVVDFDNPQRQLVVANYCAAGIGMVIALFFVAQRVYVRIMVHHSFESEDYCAVMAWAFTVAMQGLIINGFVKGTYGTHAWEMPLKTFAHSVLMSNYVQPIVYVFPTMLSKLALLIFYIRLHNLALWYQCAVWSTIVITVGSSLGILFSVAFACTPISMSYDITVTDGTCIYRETVYEATAAFGIITDIFIFLIPIPMVMTLQLTRRKKAGLLLIFTIGSATVVTSIARLYLLVRYLKIGDATWIGGPIFLWVSIEANLLVICSCLPTLKHFIHSTAPRLLGSDSHNGRLGRSHPGSANLHSNNGHKKMLSSTRISGRPRHNREHYHAFDDEDEYRLETLVESGSRLHDGPLRARGNQNVFDDRDTDGDDDSCRGIIQTNTPEVRHEPQST